MEVDLLPASPLTPWTTLIWEFEEGSPEARLEQLWLAYQPVVSVSTSEVVAAECLLRWNHPKHGRISPADFIPLMEHSGMILKVGQLVLSEACLQGKAWKSQDLFLRICVNVSAMQMRSESLVNYVSTALHMADMDSKDLVLEITESMPMEWAGRPQETLAALTKMGVKVVLDDFGSGYASLVHLKNPLLSGIKIDSTVVADIHVSSRLQKMFTHVCRMADDLGMTVVAEGVEIKQQLEALASVGVREVQGFYFSEALAPDEILPYARAQRRRRRG